MQTTQIYDVGLIGRISHEIMKSYEQTNQDFMECQQGFWALLK